jgi:1-acyl-sn-glycerol-3-phosphate acyltransferase
VSFGDRSLSDRGKRAFYQVARGILVAVCKVAFRVRVHGREKVPRSGPYVVAPSHRSIVDIFLTGFVTSRRIRFMAKQELFENRVLAWLIDAGGGFAVDRDSADRAALRAAQAALESGEPVAVFPEGTRRAGLAIGDLFDGAAYLATRVGVPVVPVAIGGSEAILPSGKSRPRLHRVAIVVGDPILPPQREGRARREEVKQMTGQLAVELQKRFDEANALAGVPRRS